MVVPLLGSASAIYREFTVHRTFSGRNLRQARLAAGLKPEKLALLIDRSVWAIHQYEAGRACPSAAVLGSLSDVLQVPVDAFYSAAVAHAAA